MVYKRGPSSESRRQHSASTICVPPWPLACTPSLSLSHLAMASRPAILTAPAEGPALRLKASLPWPLPPSSYLVLIHVRRSMDLIIDGCLSEDVIIYCNLVWSIKSITDRAACIQAFRTVRAAMKRCSAAFECFRKASPFSIRDRCSLPGQHSSCLVCQLICNPAHVLQHNCGLNFWRNGLLYFGTAGRIASPRSSNTHPF